MECSQTFSGNCMSFQAKISAEPAGSCYLPFGCACSNLAWSSGSELCSVRSPWDGDELLQSLPQQAPTILTFPSPNEDLPIPTSSIFFLLKTKIKLPLSLVLPGAALYPLHRSCISFRLAPAHYTLNPRVTRLRYNPLETFLQGADSHRTTYSLQTNTIPPHFAKRCYFHT